MLVTDKYFKGELLIPNLESNGLGISGSICLANIQTLDDLINKYEPLFLTKLLGNTLCDEFLKGIGEPEPLTKWQLLKEMLVNEDKHLSPIANYVYYWFMRNEATKTTGVGETVGQANNAAIVSADAKMIRAWNEMTDSLTAIVSFLDAHRADYPDFCPDVKADIFFHINTLNL